ncbi:hypothetical protein [Allocoleopsis sp.]|uniref:hypothetical protein n=1 Tax=Allocoleopsis sp. TaxID=3088169 RepID=UPI002FD71F0A
MQQGTEYYQAGNCERAIALWQTVLNQQRKGSTYSSDELTALKNLVSAYRRLHTSDFNRLGWRYR